MKDDRLCEYCTYKNVPTYFSPCLGCPGNMDKLAQPHQAAGAGQEERQKELEEL